jgi:2-phospho-L-lactate transferase/gluconeogenesis factor (CofD/UPF0052 family)
MEVGRADAVLYAIGSLYTSICPNLILDGVGEALAGKKDVPKVRAGNLVLVSFHDYDLGEEFC